MIDNLKGNISVKYKFQCRLAVSKFLKEGRKSESLPLIIQKYPIYHPDCIHQTDSTTGQHHPTISTTCFHPSCLNFTEKKEQDFAFVVTRPDIGKCAENDLGQ